MKMPLTLLAVFSCVVAFSAEKNFLTNGDFSKLDSKQNPVSWRVDGKEIKVVREKDKSVLRVKSERKHNQNFISLRHTMRNVPEGAYVMSGEVKGNVTELRCVFNFPPEVQKNVTFTRGIMQESKDGWIPFRINMIVPKKSTWAGVILSPITQNTGDELQFRSFRMEPKAVPAVAVPVPAVKKDAAAGKTSGYSRQNQFFLPSAIYAVPGVECNIYYKNIFLTLNYSNYMFEVECAAGRNDQDRWRFLPKAADAGKKYPLTITVKDTDGIVAKSSTVVYVTPVDAGKGKAISLLMVGDSLTAGGDFSARVKELFDKEKDGVKLTMVGSQKHKKFPGVAHEGYGGWTWASFVVLTSSPDGKRPVSKFMYKKANGFVFDLHEFVKKYNNGKMPDVITFQLGGNDIFLADDNSRKYKIVEVLENADRLINLFRSQAPDASIGVGFTTPSATSQDAFGIHYKCGQTMWGYTQNQFRLIQAMSVHFGEKMKKDKKLFLIPTHLNLDRDHNFPKMEEEINYGNSKKIIRQCNGLHPELAGYRQVGDSLYAWLKYQLNQKK